MKKKTPPPERPERSPADRKAARERKRVTAPMLESVKASFGYHCRCDLYPGQTFKELTALGSGCSAGQWVCPCLNALRIRLDKIPS